MKVVDSVVDLVGGTPLVRLNNIVEPDMAIVYAKMENLNPSGSVKDRMAINMVKRAEEAGLLKPGGTIVESTSGNTGLGLAMAAAVRGYRCVFTIPDKMSQEKIDMLKSYGAEVIVTETALDHHHPDSYVEVAKRVARETPGAFYTDQYSNPHNPEAHYVSTGPEIWKPQTARSTPSWQAWAQAAQSPGPENISRRKQLKPGAKSEWSARTPTEASIKKHTKKASGANLRCIGLRALAMISW